jgi:hypothetical protein
VRLLIGFFKITPYQSFLFTCLMLVADKTSMVDIKGGVEVIISSNNLDKASVDLTLTPVFGQF